MHGLTRMLILLSTSAKHYSNASLFPLVLCYLERFALLFLGQRYRCVNDYIVFAEFVSPEDAIAQRRQQREAAKQQRIEQRKLAKQQSTTATAATKPAPTQTQSKTEAKAESASESASVCMYENADLTEKVVQGLLKQLMVRLSFGLFCNTLLFDFESLSLFAFFYVSEQRNSF